MATIPTSATMAVTSNRFMTVVASASRYK
jgi:hypothetical protein